MDETDRLTVPVWPDAGRALGVGRDSMYRFVREGRLRVVRIGRKIVVPRSELEAFLQRETKSA